MNWSGKSIVGIALLIFGGLVFLGMFGIHLGGIIAFLIALGLVYYGVKKLKTSATGGQKAIGIIALVIGIMMFVGSLPLLITLLFSAMLIYFGWKMIKKDRGDMEPEPAYSSEAGHIREKVEVENNFDSEWKDFLKRNK